MGMDYEFKKGMKVVKMFYGLEGYREATMGKVTKVSKGVAYFEDDSGVTFDAKTGRELENFFPGMRTEITPLLGAS